MDERLHEPSESPPRLAGALLPPRLSPAHVRRSRLTETLERGVDGPVTLICGPPGSGKTSLLCSWLAEPGRAKPVAWVSLDESRDDPTLLWDTVLAALRGVCGDSPVAALAPPVRGSHPSFMPRLVNDLAAMPEPVVLVLDDVHVLRSRECLAQLAFLVLHLPPTLRIVLSGRADPPLPLHVPRVLGTLTEIRSRALAFTETEAAELLTAHGLALDRRLVGTLCRRTEGWAAGLRLAALGLQGHEDPDRFVTEFGGDDRVIADYLVAEVLDRQPARRRRFLLQTAIADRVCGELADAITGGTTGAETLAELERSNGFVVGLDARECWYRYHALFARLLEVRAHREFGHEMRALHARAARWHARDGSIWPALRHSVAGEDWQLAAELTVASGMELVVSGQGGSLGALVAQLPPELVTGDAELAAIVACSLLDAGDVAAAEPYLEAAARTIPQLGPGRLRALAETRAIARLYLARLQGDVGEALACADELLAEADRHSAPSSVSRQALVSSNVGRIALWAGEIERAERELELAVALGRAHQLDHLLVGALGQLALLEVSRRGPDHALPLIGEALELACRRGWTEVAETGAAHLAACAAALAAHRLQAAAEHLRAARVATTGSLDVRLAAAARDLAARLAEAGDSSSVRGLTPPWASAGAAPTALERARRQLEDDDPYEALATLEAARPELAVTRLELLVLKARALGALERPDVHQVFETALAEAEASGERAALLAARESLGPLLIDAIRHGTAHRALVGELLDLLEDREPVTAGAMAEAAATQRLSDRELAVVRFLPTTLSNREIASELLISTNTVKTHLRSIYRKLDVPDRRGAAERARALGLLSRVAQDGAAPAWAVS